MFIKVYRLGIIAALRLPALTRSCLYRAHSPEEYHNSKVETEIVLTVYEGVQSC